MVTANQKSINIIDIHTQKKKEFKRRTKDSHPIIREQKRKGRKKNLPPPTPPPKNGYTHRNYTIFFVKASGIYSLGYCLIYIWEQEGAACGAGDREVWGRPGRLDTDSTSSHLSGLPSRGTALPFGGGGGGFMHHLRPLISSFWFHRCFLEGPSNWFLFMVQRKEGPRGSYSWSKDMIGRGPHTGASPR